MKRTSLISLLALLCCLSATGQVTVWPGDANNNGIANHVDLLYVGLAHGAIGPVRDSLSNISWVPNQGTSIWQQTTQNGVDYAFVDTDGNGFIDNMDTSAIGQNYDLTHGVVVPDSGTAFSTSSPSLALDFAQDSILLFGDTLVMVNIVLGDSLSVLDSIYGLAFTVEFDSNVVDSAFFSLQGGFLTSTSSVLSMGRVKQASGKVEMAITRVNHVNAAGQGAIGSIGIVMDDNLRTGQDFEVGLRITNVVAFAAGGSPVPLRPLGDTLKVNSPALSSSKPINGFNVYPVPADHWLRVDLPTGIDEILLHDVTGKKIYMALPEGTPNILLDVKDLPPGAYLLSLRSGEGWHRKKVLVQ